MKGGSLGLASYVLMLCAFTFLLERIPLLAQDWEEGSHAIGIHGVSYDVSTWSVDTCRGRVSTHLTKDGFCPGVHSKHQVYFFISDPWYGSVNILFRYMWSENPNISHQHLQAPTHTIPISCTLKRKNTIHRSNSLSSNHPLPHYQFTWAIRPCNQNC